MERRHTAVAAGVILISAVAHGAPKPDSAVMEEIVVTAPAPAYLRIDAAVVDAPLLTEQLVEELGKVSEFAGGLAVEPSPKLSLY